MSMLQSPRSNSNQVTPNSTLTIIDQLQFSILLCAVSVTPLLFWLGSNELFEFPKMVFVYFIAITLWLLIVARWILQRHISWLSTPFNIPIICFLVIVIISTLFSQDSYTSVAGYYSRFNGGLASYLAYALIFFATVDTVHITPTSFHNSIPPHWREIVRQWISLDWLRSSTTTGQPQTIDTLRRRYLLWAWVLSATLVSLWGILEHFGLDPSCVIVRGAPNLLDYHTWQATCWVQDVQARVFATFGQPNWLAAYLVGTLPLGLGMLFSSHRHWTRVISAICCILIYAALWYTYSRAGWIGLMVALVILAAAISKDTLWQWRYWLAAILLACLAISATSFGSAALRTETSLSGRGDDSSTGAIRLSLWASTIPLILDHPLIGTGPGTFAYSFLPYRPASLNQTTEWNFLFNEAHNEVLNQASTLGILGLISWLAIFVVAGVVGWKQRVFVNVHRLWVKIHGSRFTDLNNTADNQESGAKSSIPAALIASIAGTFTAQLFGFSVVATNLVLFIALTLITTPSAKLISLPLPLPSLPLKRLLSGIKAQIAWWSQRPSTALFLLICLLSIPIAYGLLYRYTAAEVASKQGQDALNRGSLLLATSDLQRATSLNPWEPSYHTQLAMTHLQFATIAQPTEQPLLLQQADNQIQQAINLNPYNQITLKTASYIYQSMARLDASYEAKAIQAATSAYKLAPTDPTVAQTLALLSIEQGHLPQARSWLDLLKSLRPHTAETLYTQARYAQATGYQTQAASLLNQALDLEPHYPEAKSWLEKLQSDNRITQ